MKTIWIARDELPAYRSEICTCLFVGKRPGLVDGFWYQVGKDSRYRRFVKNMSGRHPIDGLMKLKPGEVRRLKLTEVEEL